MGILSNLFSRNLPTDVVDLLTAQHEEVDALFEQLEKGEGSRQRVFKRLADTLAAHAAAEEQVFYPAVMAKDTNALLHESVEEHLGIKRIIADLVTMRVDDATFVAKIAVLKEQVTHHAHREEEKKLFPLINRMFSAEERAAIGNDVLAVYEQTLIDGGAKLVPDETAKAAPLPQPSAR